MNKHFHARSVLSALLLLLMPTQMCHAQAEVEGWGDFRGIRMDGELMRFASSIRALSPDQKIVAFTATQMVKEPTWVREDSKQTSTGAILSKDGRSLHFREIIEDLEKGSAKVDVEVTADADFDLAGIYYFINVPATDYAGGSARFTTADASDEQQTSLQGGVTAESVKMIRLISSRRDLEVQFSKPAPIVISKDRFIDTDIATQDGLRLPRDERLDELISLRFPIGTGKLAKGESVRRSFTIKAGGQIDRQPVQITIDPSKRGAEFDGIGGNFRVWGGADLASAEYNLTNLRVPWARVAMPLAAWQRTEGRDPIDVAGGDRDDRDVRQCMEIAKILSEKHIPIVISTWNMPEWSLFPPGPPLPGRPFVIPARRVKPEKQNAVYDAIVSYLNYLKSQYSVEAEYFSLNECDLGIDILQTPQEHAEFIKEVGRRFKDAGLRTRMLLADASSPHPIKFVEAALLDPEALTYVGAVSYHSWHDGTDQEFGLWGETAQQLNVPLFIAEGGTDADSHRYPAIFQEPWYPLYEIETYVRICEFSQPRSILHWQMTANYSILVGGGPSGEPLAPGRRFWQIKQINLTPPGSAALAIKISGAAISACAYQSQARCLVHVVNSGATREATVVGLPPSARKLHLYLTDATDAMKALPPVAVTAGSAHFDLPKESLLTLMEE